MKTIYNIAKTELKVLFYSPVAWLILVIFTFQSAFLFTGIFENYVNIKHLGYTLNKATIGILGGWGGLFTKIQAYVYLYIPLLTMNIISRELASGSIKLLYSSPVKNSQIILGKYLALVAFGLVLTGILALFGVFAATTIVNAEIPYILCGLLGVFLLICAYAAIGLFMSSLTLYNIVAAIGTLTVLALLNYVGSMGQEYDFVRDLTYWLSLQGRSSSFISGMLTTEDLLYFIIIISLFLLLCIIRLNASRQKIVWTKTIGQYAAVVILAFGLGYLSALPGIKKYYDTTYSKVNTLSVSSQQIVEKLDGGLTIHAYSNVLDPTGSLVTPGTYRSDYERFEKYIRFKPETKMKYTYYYKKTSNPMLEQRFPNLSEKELVDTLKVMNNWNFDIVPYAAIRNEVDLAPENFRFVRMLERDNGDKVVLRVFEDMIKNPTESEISAAIKRLVQPSPVLGVVEGHKERKIEGQRDEYYTMIASEKTFRYSMLNQGVDVESVSLDQPVPANVTILMIGDPKVSLTDEELKHLSEFVDRGDNLLITGEPGEQEIFNALTTALGVRMLPGRLVGANSQFQADLLLLSPTQEAVELSSYLAQVKNYQSVVSFPGAGALDYSQASEHGFASQVLFETDSVGFWNTQKELDGIDESIRIDAIAGEKEDAYATALFLEREHKGKQQRIFVSGDADWLSNGEMARKRNGVEASNFSLVAGTFNWLTNGEVPVDLSHPAPIDSDIRIGKASWKFLGPFIKWGIPVLLVALGAFILLRRKSK